MSSSLETLPSSSYLSKWTESGLPECFRYAMGRRQIYLYYAVARKHL